MGAVLVHIHDVVEHVNSARQQTEASRGQNRRNHGARVVNSARKYQGPQYEEVLDPLVKAEGLEDSEDHGERAKCSAKRSKVYALGLQ
jgi:hypothetical protein